MKETQGQIGQIMEHINSSVFGLSSLRTTMDNLSLMHIAYG